MAQSNISVSTWHRAISQSAHGTEQYLSQHMAQSNISVSKGHRAISQSAHSTEQYLSQQMAQSNIWVSTLHRAISPSVHVTEKYLRQHMTQYMLPRFLKHKRDEPRHWSGGRTPRILELQNRLRWWLIIRSGVSAQGAPNKIHFSGSVTYSAVPSADFLGVREESHINCMRQDASG